MLSKGDIVRHRAGKIKLEVIGVVYDALVLCQVPDKNPAGRNRVPAVPPPYFETQTPGHTFDVAYPVDDMELVK